MRERLRVCFEGGGSREHGSRGSKGQRCLVVCCVAESGTVLAAAPVCEAAVCHLVCPFL